MLALWWCILSSQAVLEPVAAPLALVLAPPSHQIIPQVDVSGWTVVRADRSPSSDGWQIPPGVNVPAGGVMVILFPSKKRT